MKRIRWWQHAATSLAGLGLILPHGAMATETPTAPVPVASSQDTPAIHDVALQNGGVLTGQVVNAQGVALSGAEVSIHSAGKTISSTRTDSQGMFAFRGLSGG